jgi:peptidoglycan/xylan/chitin deacetylase (PgdA/CDA1 family)
MYLHRIPELVKPLFGDLLWRMPTTERVIYLTFDDGPTPGVTDRVLDILNAHQAKATFFCVGRHAASEPTLIERMRNEGHALGNHTWEHLDGWRTPTTTYLRSVLKGQPFTGSDLFRPPYGHLTREQAHALRARYKVVMWDILSADFDPALTADQCERNVMTRLRPGSIIVFHDSLKAWPRLQGALPRVLTQAADDGYRFEALPTA